MAAAATRCIPTPVRALVLALLLVLAGGGTVAANEAKHGAAKPPEAAPAGEKPPAEAKKPPKPKPKKPDKEKNCAWEEDVDIEIDNKHLRLSQLSLKNVMRGGESEQNGYNVYADTDKLVLKLRAPDGNWYIANMTRLGDMNEGCVFYLVGEPKQVEGEPPLY
ncbi:MAG: hypothetical protein WCO00_03835 [Rhodospirillaceae bacterium]